MSEGSEQIGPYAVEREIGRGGMGVVYLGRDRNLDRPVAIKSLPEHFAQDPARLDRFEREARTLAQLSHPNVAGIYGVEEKDGSKYLVLEYVEGETLQDLLDRGPLSLDDALEIGAQIASGVEAAHDAGIIHRDLKPANIKITPGGAVKVLDFGLARTEDASSSAVLSESPTITTPVNSPTIEGAILGTAPYMSPEQARGRRVDKRTDIWSFGLVLYEMLTGIAPFAGETATDSIGKILHKDVEWSALPAPTPRRLRWVLDRCLRRNKDERLHDIGDARIELAEMAQGTEEEETQVVEQRRSRAAWVWGVVAAMLAVALGAALLTRSPAEAPDSDARSSQTIESLRRLTDFPELEQHPSLSPDGKSVVYAAREGGDSDIFLLRVGGENPINLTADSPADDIDPAFSPDGERIAFASTRGNGGVYVMGATGENPRRVAPEGFDPAWSPDGTLLACTTDIADNPFGRPAIGEIFTVELSSGEINRLVAEAGDVPAGSVPHDAVAPQWSPDGKRLVYWCMEGGQRDLFWVDATGGKRTRLTDDAATDWDPVWGPDGRSILFMSDRGGQRGLWRLNLTEEWLTEGDPIAIMPGPTQVIEFTQTPDARLLVVRTEHERTLFERVSFDPATLAFGADARILHSTPWGIFDFDVSDDGEWLVYRVAGAIGDDIVVTRTDGTMRRTLLRDEFRDRGTQFSEDASSITYFSNRTGDYAIWTINRDGTDPRILVQRDDSGLGTPCWTSDYSAFASHRMNPLGTAIYTKDKDGRFTDEPREIDGFVNPIAWSHDDRLLLGLRERQDGLLSLVAFDSVDGTFSFVKTPTGRFIDSGGLATRIAWIDDKRIIGWSQNEKRAYVSNAVTGEASWIESPFRDRVDFSAFSDGNLDYARISISGDLWLVEFDTGTR